MMNIFPNPNAYITTALCAKLPCTDAVLPLSFDEWADFYSKISASKLDPTDLLGINENNMLEDLEINYLTRRRIEKLFNCERLKNMSDMISCLERYGIYLATVYDWQYPDKLKEKLCAKAPPILYYAGNLSLLEEKQFGIVCTHNADNKAYIFSKQLSDELYRNGYIISITGTSGAELYACDYILKRGGKVVIWLCDNMISQYRNEFVIKSLEEGRMLIVSDSIPNAHYNSQNAAMRNECFYTLCNGVAIIKANYKHGGTWASAVNAIRKNYTTLYCFDSEDYYGNRELLRLGVKAINEKYLP